MRTVIVMLGGLALTLAGCATSGGGDEGVRAENVCLNDYQITSFSPVGDTFLYVKGIGDRHYLFTMERGCVGLRSANTIGIPDRGGRICSNSSDRVIYRDVARGAESCRILDIESVASSEDARAIAEQREELRRQRN
jgi:hypothetical protein